MENRLLKYFLVVAEEENITRAAEILHVSQPALSKQLMQLEDELGAKLLIRGKRSVTLTEEGRFLRGRAQEIIDLTEKTERDFKDGIVKYNGVVSIGMGETGASEWLAEKVSEFSELFPEVKFDFYSATGDSVRRRIEKGLLDFGLLVEPFGDLSKFSYLPLPMKEQYGVLISTQNPLSEKQYITKEDLLGERIILPFRYVSRLKETGGENFFENNAFITHNLLFNVATMVKKNKGVCLTIGGATSLYDKNELVWKPLFPKVEFSNVIIWKKYKQESPSASKFLEFINHSVSL